VIDRQKKTEAPSGGIRLAFLLNLAFTLIEIAGGLWTNSVAILSDAVHDLGDSLSLGLAWFLDHYSQRDRDRRFSYGYRRFSLLGALFTAFVLFAGSFFVLSEALPRLLRPEPANAAGMAGFAIAGILANGAAVLRLRGSRSLNARVVLLHLLEDVLGWLSVLIVAVILLFTDLYLLDPLLSLLITCYVLFNVFRNLRETVQLFLQGVPAGINLDALEKELVEVDGVRSVHHTHVWSLDGEHHVLTAHVVVDESADRVRAVQVKKTIKEHLRKYELSHLTIEIEFGQLDCAMD